MSKYLWNYEGTFKPATDVNLVRIDVYADFRCPCGQTPILAESGDMTRCDCGKVYRLQCYVEVAE